MGFRTLAIEKRSSEVWQVLGAIKAEFTNYGTILDKVKKKLDEASSSVDAVGQRQRVIARKLKSVEIAPDGTSDAVLGLLPQSTGLDSDE
jgi:DNA recombination protein RmuC